MTLFLMSVVFFFCFCLSWCCCCCCCWFFLFLLPAQYGTHRPKLAHVRLFSLSLFHAHSVTSQSFALSSSSSFPFLFLLSLFLLCRVLHYLWPRVLPPPPPPPPSSPLGLSLSFCPFYYFDKGDGDERRGKRRARRSHFSQKRLFYEWESAVCPPRTVRSTKKSTFFALTQLPNPTYDRRPCIRVCTASYQTLSFFIILFPYGRCWLNYPVL